MIEVADWVVWVSTVLGAITGIGLAMRWVRNRWKKVEHFIEDWNGEPARPGVPGRAGVMTRLSNVESQFHPNGGNSMRDVVNGIRADLTEHLEDHSRSGLWSLEVTEDGARLEQRPPHAEGTNNAANTALTTYNWKKEK